MYPLFWLVSYLKITLLIFKNNIRLYSRLHNILRIALNGTWLQARGNVAGLFYLVQIEQLGYRQYLSQLAKMRLVLLGNGDNVLVEEVHDGVQAHGAVEVANSDFKWILH